MATDLPQRILTLDVTRGLAVMGIALMNVAVFAMFEWATIHPRLGGGTEPLNMVVWALEFVFVEHKMRGLFSLLFGASLLLFMERAEHSGREPRGLVYRRLFWLFFFGVLHFTLLWSGDILAFYAVIGLFAVLFSRQSAQRLVALAALAFLLNALVWVGFTGKAMNQWQQLHDPDTPVQVVSAIERRAVRLTDPAAPDIAEDRALYRSGYGAIVRSRVTEHWQGQITILKLYGFETLGLMLLGMAMLRGGFFSATCPPSALRRIANWSGAIGIGGMAGLIGWIFVYNLHPFTTFLGSLMLSLPFRLALVLAYAALIALWCQERKQLSLKFRLAETGQMAFTNYIVTSLVFGLIYYGYGLGLYERMDRFAQLLVALAMCALMLVWSPWWMARFRHGPLEWVWRCLTRAEFVALRREAIPLG
jgi:uncharacterized protein